MDIAVISSLEDAEGITAGRDIDQVSLQINIDTPLKDAADIKCKTRAGTLGFPVVNPELLDCKCVAKNELEKKFDLMLKQWMRYCENEMNAVDLLIATVKQNLAIPADNVPPHGPPLAERIRGIHQCIYLESLVKILVPHMEFLKCTLMFPLVSSVIFRSALFCFLIFPPLVSSVSEVWTAPEL